MIDIQKERIDFWSQCFRDQLKLNKTSECAARFANDCLEEFSKRFGEARDVVLAELVLKTLDTQQKYFKSSRSWGSSEESRNILIESKQLEKQLRDVAMGIMTTRGLDNTSGEPHT